MWKAKVVVTYKPGILDPEAKTIHHALVSLGYTDFKNVETGKYFQLTFKEKMTRDQAETVAREACDKLLSNPVIQKYTYEMTEVSE
ncbi:MAG: phosphoribosylformylglycinamidine synthase subunit PurS [Candidatus Neomarinimicrobiota bacterium]